MTRLLSLCLIWIFCATFSAAQDESDAPASLDEVVEEAAAAAPVPELDPEWAALASRAVGAVEGGRVSTPILDDLRADLVEWRDVFLDRQTENAGRIQTVESQLSALGSAPDDGVEASDIIERREALTAELTDLRRPRALAAEAHAQADGLISEIDAIIRERQTDRFVDRGTSPLDPTVWSRARDAASAALRAMRGEIETALASPTQRRLLLQATPLILAFGLIAFVLLLRGRRWIGRLEGMVRARTSRGRGVWAFFVSLGKIVLPFVGLMAFTSAIDATGLMGRRLTGVVSAIPFLGLYPIFAHWLAGQLLPLTDPPTTNPLGLEPARALRLNRGFILLGYLLGLAGLVAVWMSVSGIEGTSAAVISFPFGLTVAFVLFRIGRSLMSGRSDDEPEDDARPFRSRILSLIGQLTIAVALIGPVLAALGYTSAFQMIVFPAASTLYLLAILVLCQRLVFDIYALVTGAEDGADGLVPVSIAFILALAAMPVLALLWGVRTTDLTELWTRFGEGFALGETRISPGDFLTFAIVFIIGYTLVRLLQAALKSTVLPKTRLDIGGQNAVSAGVGYVGIFLAAVAAITTAGIDLSGLAIVAGALSVGIGFGLQNIVSNFVSGIILLIERPISEGDWIEVGGQMGYVRNISVRSTRIETFDRTDVIVPNADLVSGTVTNYTRGNSVGRLIVRVGVAYGSDTRKVSEVLQEIAEAHPMVLLNPAPSVVFAGFGADSLDFEIRAILRDVNFILSVQTEINHQIAARFEEEGFEIPFAQRDIWLRNPETLRGSDPDEGGSS